MVARLALALLFTSAAVVGCQRTGSGTVSVKVAPGTVIQAEVVSSTAALSLGLSGRDSLPANQGMLFIFSEPGYYGFWMRDMRFSIDVLWLQGGRIVELWENAPAPLPGGQPSRYDPTQLADAVLEVPAGSTARWGLGVGSQVGLPPRLDLVGVSR